jgi:hypothetical protein
MKMKMIGEMAAIGIKRWRPKGNLEYAVQGNDAINMSSKIELYISRSKLRLRVHAFK